MDIFGVKVPWWALALLAALVFVLVVGFLWSTIVGVIGLILKILGLVALLLVGLWVYKKFVRRS